MKLFTSSLLLVLLLTSNSFAQTDYDQDKKEILTVMMAQQAAWSAGDIEGFMQGYWKSEDLKFYGKSGLTKGWQQTLDNYKRGYPSIEQMGTLKFTIQDVSLIETESYWVMGQYHLTRTVGDAQGVFIVIFKKIEGAWKIVADMSC